MATTVPDSDPNKTPTSQQNRDHDSDTSVASTAVGPVSSKTSATLSSTTQQTTSDQHVTTTPGIIVQTSTPSSSQSSTFTTQMTTSKIFSAPSSTSSRTPSSSINWGPAITASPLPATETVGPDNNPNQPSAGFSSNSRNAVIISTTIGKSATIIDQSQEIANTRLRRHDHPRLPFLCTLAQTERCYVRGNCSLQATLEHHHSQSIQRPTSDSAAHLPRVTIFRQVLQATWIHCQFQ